MIHVLHASHCTYLYKYKAMSRMIGTNEPIEVTSRKLTKEESCLLHSNTEHLLRTRHCTTLRRGNVKNAKGKRLLELQGLFENFLHFPRDRLFEAQRSLHCVMRWIWSYTPLARSNFKYSINIWKSGKCCSQTQFPDIVDDRKIVGCCLLKSTESKYCDD
jgi:hypothetical protein